MKLNVLKEKIEDTPDDQFEDTLRKYMNVSSYLVTLAVDVLVLDIDKFWFSGKNYYLYENTETNKMEWIPWDYNLALNYFLDGTDQEDEYKKFVENGIFDDKVLIHRIMENDNLKNEYLSKLCLLRTYFNTTTLFDKINTCKALIQEDVEDETKRPYTYDEFLGNIETTDYNDLLPNPVPGIKKFIADRTAVLDTYLESISFDCNLGIDTDQKVAKGQVYPNPLEPGGLIVF